MSRDLDRSTPIEPKDCPTQQLPLRELIYMYLTWFFLSGLTEMTQQLVFQGSLFLTQGIHFLFFIAFRLLFIPVALYFIIYRHFMNADKVGLNFGNFWRWSKLGYKLSFPLIPLTLLLVHLPLIYHSNDLRPMVEATTLSTIAVSLVYSILLFFMTLIPAFSEELLFRGFTFSFVQERLGTGFALFFNSILYAVFYMQFNPYLFLIRVLIGFFTTYLFWRTKSLIPSTFVQASFHTAMILYIFGWSWW